MFPNRYYMAPRIVWQGLSYRDRRPPHTDRSLQKHLHRFVFMVHFLLPADT